MGSMKKELDDLRQRDRDRQDQFNLYTANVATQQQASQEPAKQHDPDDLMTYGEHQKALQDQNNRFESALSELQVRSKFQDFDEVVNQDSLKPLVTEFPELQDVVMSSKNPNLLAYLLGKGQKLSTATKTANETSKAKAEQIVSNSQRPGSSAGAVGGSGALGKADMYANMTSDEFMRHVEKVKRGG